MKTLELNQMKSLEGGKDCQKDALAFMVGATVGGALAGGPAGFMVGGLIGVLGGTFMSIAKIC
jgi:hypothetical protein